MFIAYTYYKTQADAYFKREFGTAPIGSLTCPARPMTEMRTAYILAVGRRKNLVERFAIIFTYRCGQENAGSAPLHIEHLSDFGKYSHLQPDQETIAYVRRRARQVKYGYERLWRIKQADL